MAIVQRCRVNSSKSCLLAPLAMPLRRGGAMAESSPGETKAYPIFFRFRMVDTCHILDYGGDSSSVPVLRQAGAVEGKGCLNHIPRFALFSSLKWGIFFCLFCPFFCGSFLFLCYYFLLQVTPS